MPTDPPTSPNRTDEQIELGFVVGLVTYGAFLALPGLTFLLLGLLSGNVWLAWRRMRRAGQPVSRSAVSRQPSAGSRES